MPPLPPLLESFEKSLRKLCLDKDGDRMEVLRRSFVVDEHKLFVAYQLPGQRSETVRRSNLSSILNDTKNRFPNGLSR